MVRQARHAAGRAGALRLAGAGWVCAAFLAGCGSGDSPSQQWNEKPAFLGSVASAAYDGVGDDLLTAGLGASGLASATPPGYADAGAPTAPEMRRAAIYYNYRGLVDTTAAGGYGSLYGPSVNAAGTPTGGSGKIAGTEYLAFSDDGSHQQNVPLVVQVPESFSKANACIVAVGSSGSRGVYGGISVGEWGLKRGCAVAYTDKGTGAAPHDLQNDTVPLIDGRRTGAAQAGSAAQFNAGLSAAELAAFNAATPHRLAFKHAHSGRNVEKDWGLSMLQSVEFALYVLNERYGEQDGGGRRLATFTPANTVIIASGVSNGGEAAIAAAEQDTRGLIHGVAVSEPALPIVADAGIAIRRGGALVPVAGKPVVDFTSYANLYQTCAALAPSIGGSPYAATYAATFASPGFPVAPNRCAALKAQGLLSASTTAGLAEEALQKLLAYGWEAETLPLHASHAALEAAPALATTYANALSRASVADHLCGISYAVTAADGSVIGAAAPLLAGMSAAGNGVPPSAGVNLVNNNSLMGPVRDVRSLNAAGVPDWNLDGALCLRSLVTGNGAQALKLRAGLDETRRNGNLRGKPAIIVHGRADTLLPVNHSSRPYFGLNKKVEGPASRLSYMEVANAQHLDTLIGQPSFGYDSRFVPLYLYLHRALDAVHAHLKSGSALPASQVVRTVPRGGTPGAAPPITAAHVPVFSPVPAASDAIGLSAATVTIPD